MNPNHFIKSPPQSAKENIRKYDFIILFYLNIRALPGRKKIIPECHFIKFACVQPQKAMISFVFCPKGT